MITLKLIVIDYIVILFSHKHNRACDK